MKKLNTFIFLFLLIFLASCSSDEITSNDQSPDTSATLNENVREFLNDMMNVMQDNSINRNDIDWVQFRRRVLESADDAESIAEIDGALRVALQLLGDNHSFIRKVDGTSISGSVIRCEPVKIPDFIIPDDIGYVKVTSFTGTENLSTVSFAQEIQNQIRNADHQDISGWIIDLRGNTGGNMWPMLAGLGPMFSEDIQGYFVGPDGAQQTWGYSEGASRINGTPIVQLSAPYQLINANPKVAVLLDRAVASSGEAIAISFIGRENTRSFGIPTCGLSTGNASFSLRDGYSLFLTTVYMADRNENIYGVPILPDTSTSEVDIIQTAIDYIYN